MKEHLRDAAITAQIAAERLQFVLASAKAVDALLIIPMIERAAALERDIRALYDAVAADGRE
jgi:hypothetical protein